MRGISLPEPGTEPCSSNPYQVTVLTELSPHPSLNVYNLYLNIGQTKCMTVLLFGTYIHEETIFLSHNYIALL
jgi:hypothetical protein